MKLNYRLLSHHNQKQPSPKPFCLLQKIFYSIFKWIPFNIKSDSFRIKRVSSLLKKTTVQHAAQIIGDSDIKSTMSYKPYAPSKKYKNYQIVLKDKLNILTIYKFNTLKIVFKTTKDISRIHTVCSELCLVSGACERIPLI